MILVKIQELKAIKKAIENVGFEPTDEIITNWYNDDTVTINQGRNGKYYAWCLFEGHESCVEIETLKEITQEEIHQELC